MMTWSHVYIWVSGILQVVRVDMGICTLKDTAPTQQPWAPSCSTTESVVELASSSNATGASGACLPIKPSPSLPPTSVHPTSRNPAITEDGAMSLDLTSTWPCLLSCRWRSMSAALSLSTTEGRSIVCFFAHPSIRLLWSQHIFPLINLFQLPVLRVISSKGQTWTRLCLRAIKLWFITKWHPSCKFLSILMRVCSQSS